MGIQTEYNPDLALRSFCHYQEGQRQAEECLPENLEEGKVYNFLKKGQRNYWLEGECPLLKTEGNQNLSLPIASIVILEATHFLLNSEPYTKGKYKITKVFNEGKIYFNGFSKINPEHSYNDKF